LLLSFLNQTEQNKSRILRNLVFYILFALPFAVFTQKDSSVFFSYDILTEESIELDNRMDSINRRYKNNTWKIDNTDQPEIILSPDQLISHNFYTSYFQRNITNPFHKTRIPLLVAGYSIGSTVENIFDLMFSQNPSEYINYTFTYRKAFAKNFLRNANVNNNDAALNFRYNSPLIKLWINGSYFKDDIGTNGGFLQDTLINNNLEINSVLRNNANNNLQGGDANIHFGVNILNDSLKILSPFIEASIYSKNRTFTEGTLDFDNVFYDTIIYDSTHTRDVFQLNNVKAAAGFHLHMGTQTLFAKYVLEYMEHITFSEKFYYQNQFIDAKYRWNQEKFNLSSDLIFHTLGDYIASLDSKSRIATTFRKKHVLFGEFRYFRAPQELQWLYNKGNTRYWENDFPYREQMNAKIGYYFKPKKLSISIGAGVVDNLVQLGEDLNPIINNEANVYFSANTKAAMQWKNFGIDWDITYQVTPSDFRMPNFIGKTNLYWQGGVFKGNALILQIGLDFAYFSTSAIRGFDAELNNFYLINSSDKIGNWPFVGAFINGKIGKRFVFFACIDNTLANLFGGTQFGAHHYPLTPQNFRFGFEWKFVN
jgi:hypothetical protein